MKSLNHPLCPYAKRHAQRGVAAVEFALIAILFFTLLLGIMEFGRWIFLLNGANEATRLGARLAAVCSVEAADNFTLIKARMSAMTGGGIPATNMVIDYASSDPLVVTCDASNCSTVTARIVGANFTPISPFFGGNFAIPQFPTSLPREYMNSAGNPVCPN